MAAITGDVHVFTVYAKKDQALMSPLTKVIRKYQCFLSLIFNVQPLLDVCAIPDHISPLPAKSRNGSTRIGISQTMICPRPSQLQTTYSRLLFIQLMMMMYNVTRINHIAKYIIFTPDELGRFEFLTKALT